MCVGCGKSLKTNALLAFRKGGEKSLSTVAWAMFMEVIYRSIIHERVIIISQQTNERNPTMKNQTIECHSRSIMVSTYKRVLTCEVLIHVSENNREVAAVKNKVVAAVHENGVVEVYSIEPYEAREKTADDKIFPSKDFAWGEKLKQVKESMQTYIEKELAKFDTREDSDLIGVIHLNAS